MHQCIFQLAEQWHLSEDPLWLSVCTVVRGHLTYKGYLYVCLQLFFIWASVGPGEMWGVCRRRVLCLAFPDAHPRWFLPAGIGQVQALCLGELLSSLNWCGLGGRAEGPGGKLLPVQVRAATLFVCDCLESRVPVTALINNLNPSSLMKLFDLMFFQP